MRFPADVSKAFAAKKTGLSCKAVMHHHAIILCLAARLLFTNRAQLSTTKPLQ